MPRRNKNARTRNKRKQLQEDGERKHNKRLENIGATITLLLVVGFIIMSLFILWVGM